MPVASPIDAAAKPDVPAIEHLLKPKVTQNTVSLAKPDKARKRGISVGDVVEVQFLEGDKKSLRFQISRTKSDAGSGIIHSEAPIAKALMGAEEGEEVEILVGSHVRKAVVNSFGSSPKLI